MTFYSNMEEVIKKLGEAGLEQILFYNGIELGLYRQNSSDVYSRVHRDNAGSPVNHIKDFIGVLESDDFFPVNGTHAGGFEYGFLYCKPDIDVRVGDEIHVKSKDSRLRNYKIIKKISKENKRKRI